jgi:hypothetical protein
VKSFGDALDPHEFRRRLDLAAYGKVYRAPATNTEVQLVRRPNGAPTLNDFAVVATERPEPGRGMANLPGGGVGQAETSQEAATSLRRLGPTRWRVELPATLKIRSRCRSGRQPDLGVHAEPKRLLRADRPVVGSAEINDSPALPFHLGQQE